MTTNAVLVGTELRLTRHEGAADAMPATLSVGLTSRIFDSLHIQLASIEAVDLADLDTERRYRLDTRRVVVSALARAVHVRADWSGESGWSAFHADLDLIIDDGDPAGPFTITRRVGELRFTAADPTAVATVALDSFTRVAASTG